MSQFVQQAAETTNQYLDALAQSQEALLEAAAKNPWLLPAQAPHATAFGEFPAGIPTPKEISEASFNFAEKLLNNQKAYAEKLLALNEAPAAGK